MSERLSSGSLRTRSEALKRLEAGPWSHPSVWAIKPLIAALNFKPRYETQESLEKNRKDIVLALGKIPGKRTLKPLIEALSDEGYSVKEAARQALIWKGTDGINALALAVQEGTLNRCAAAEIGGRIDDGAETLVLLLRSDNKEVRCFAEYSIRRLSGVRSVDVLIKLLGHQDASLREIGADRLGRIGEGRAADPLAALLADSDPSVQLGAATALSRLGDRRSVPTLIEFLKHHKQEYPYRSEIAAEALGRIGDARAVEPLIELLRTAKEYSQKVWGSYGEQENLRKTATTSLGRIEDVRAKPALVTLLDDDSEKVRLAAATTLVKTGNGQGRTKLLYLMRYGRDRRFRLAAGEAIEEFGGDWATDALISCLEDDYWPVAWTAARALRKITAKTPDGRIERIATRLERLESDEKDFRSWGGAVSCEFTLADKESFRAWLRKRESENALRDWQYRKNLTRCPRCGTERPTLDLGCGTKGRFPDCHRCGFSFGLS